MLRDAENAKVLGSAILLSVFASVYLFVEFVRRLRTAHRAHQSRILLASAIAELSIQFITNPVGLIDTEIDEALSRLTPLLNVDRISMFEFSADKTHILLTRSTDLDEAPTQFRIDDVTWYAEKLLNKEDVWITDLNTPPEQTDVLKTFLERRGIRSSFSVPLEASGSVLGAVAFNSVREVMNWPQPMIEECRLIGRIFGSAVLRKQAELAAVRAEQLSEQLADSIVDSLNIHVAVLNTDGIVLSVRNRLSGLADGIGLGSHSIARGENYLDALASALGANTKETDAAVNGIRAVSSGDQNSFVLEYLCQADHVQHWFTMRVSALMDADRIVAVVHRDITKEKYTEQTTRELILKLIRAEEEERSRIARELHDDIGPQLDLLSIELRRGRRLGPPDAELERVRTAVDRIVHGIHWLSDRLHSTKLDHLGLAAALCGLCEDISEHYGLNIEFRCQCASFALDASSSLNLFRVAQEALFNVVQHSNAKHCFLELSGNRDDLLLRIADDGCGFDVDSTSDGLGLISMREHLRSIGGLLTVRSRMSHGTKVEARLSLRGELAAA